MRVEEGVMTKHASLSENSQADGATKSDASPHDVVDHRRHSNRVTSQALSTENSDALGECNSRYGANDEDAPAQSSTDRVGRSRLPNGQWRPGISGNPKGRKPNNSANDLDVPSALKQALDKKIKVKRGG